MNLQRKKYHMCALDQGQGILLVDIETETIPRRDARGNRQYYCIAGRHIFGVDAYDQVIIDGDASQRQKYSHPAP